MSKSGRKDSWTPEEDKLLGETVINIVKNGGTQLDAFQEVAVKVDRTAPAVGFRWNSTVRKQYARQLSEAKKEGKLNRPKKYTPEISNYQEHSQIKTESFKTIDNSSSTDSSDEFPIQLNELEKFIEKYKTLTKENISLRQKLDESEKGRNQAEAKLNNLLEGFDLGEDEYRVFISLLKQARELVAKIRDEEKIRA